MARRTKFNSNDAQQVREFMRYIRAGLTLSQIARLYEVADRTVDDWVKRPELTALYQKAKIEVRLIRADQLEQFINGSQPQNANLGALIFWLKTQAQWAEAKATQEVNVKSKSAILFDEGESVSPLTDGELGQLLRRKISVDAASESIEAVTETVDSKGEE